MALPRALSTALLLLPLFLLPHLAVLIPRTILHTVCTLFTASVMLLLLRALIRILATLQWWRPRGVGHRWVLAAVAVGGWMLLAVIGMEWELYFMLAAHWGALVAAGMRMEEEVEWVEWIGRHLGWRVGVLGVVVGLVVVFLGGVGR